MDSKHSGLDAILTMLGQGTFQRAWQGNMVSAARLGAEYHFPCKPMSTLMFCYFILSY